MNFHQPNPTTLKAVLLPLSPRDSKGSIKVSSGNISQKLSLASSDGFHADICNSPISLVSQRSLVSLRLQDYQLHTYMSERIPVPRPCQTSEVMRTPGFLAWNFDVMNTWIFGLDFLCDENTWIFGRLQMGDWDRFPRLCPPSCCWQFAQKRAASCKWREKGLKLRGVGEKGFDRPPATPPPMIGSAPCKSDNLSNIFMCY